MKIVKERFKFETKFNLYWGRIYFISDDKRWKTKILWAATREYLREILLTEKPNEDELDKFANKIVQKWKTVKRGVFVRGLHYDIHGISPAEEAAALRFFKENPKA